MMKLIFIALLLTFQVFASPQIIDGKAMKEKLSEILKKERYSGVKPEGGNCAVVLEQRDNEFGRVFSINIEDENSEFFWVGVSTYFNQFDMEFENSSDAVVFRKTSFFNKSIFEQVEINRIGNELMVSYLDKPLNVGNQEAYFTECMIQI